MSSVKQHAEKLWSAIAAKDLSGVKIILQNCDKEQVKEVIEYEANKIVFSESQKQIDSLSCLHFAAKKGMHEAIKAMFETAIDSEINVDLQTSVLGYPATHYALMNSHMNSLKLLIKYGADINCEAKNGQTLIHVALAKGMRKVAAFLVNHKCDISAKDLSGNSVLHVCMLPGILEQTSWDAQERYEIVEFLLMRGADPLETDVNGDTALHCAVQHGVDTDTINLLASALSEQGAINTLNNGGHAPILLATDSSIMEILIENGADVNLAGNDGRTPLHLNTDNLQIISLLITKGADTNKTDLSGRTALHLAVCNDSINAEVITRLSSTSNAVNAQDSKGDTPLHLLCDNCYSSVMKTNIGGDVTIEKVSGKMDPIIEILIARGADVNKQNNKGQTALHRLLYNKQYQRAELLIENGADLYTEDDSGMPPRKIDTQWYARYTGKKPSPAPSPKPRHKAQVKSKEQTTAFVSSESNTLDVNQNNLSPAIVVHGGSRRPSRERALPEWVENTNKDNDNNTLHISNSTSEPYGRKSPSILRCTLAATPENEMVHDYDKDWKTLNLQRGDSPTLNDLDIGGNRGSTPRSPSGRAATPMTPTSVQSLGRQLTMLQDEMDDVKSFLEEFADEAPTLTSDESESGKAENESVSNNKSSTSVETKTSPKQVDTLHRQLTMLSTEVNDVRDYLEQLAAEEGIV